jgi:hypothetical protein
MHQRIAIGVSFYIQSAPILSYNSRNAHCTHQSKKISSLFNLSLHRQSKTPSNHSHCKAENQQAKLAASNSLVSSQRRRSALPFPLCPTSQRRLALELLLPALLPLFLSFASRFFRVRFSRDCSIFPDAARSMWHPW